MAACSSAFYVTKGFDALLGLGVEKRKASPPGEKIKLLGSHVALSRDFAEESSPAHRKEQLLAGLKK